MTLCKTKALLGRYFPQERKYVAADGNTYFFADDGSVTLNGQTAGYTNATGLSTSSIAKLDYNAKSTTYDLKGKMIGNLYDNDNATWVSLMGERWAATSSPMDHQVLAYCTYGLHFDSKMLQEMIDGHKAKVMAQAEARTREIEAENQAKAAARQNAGSGGEITRNGSVVFTVAKSGEVYKGSTMVGKIADGKIIVGGSVVGAYDPDSKIYRNGSCIGSLDGWGNVQLARNGGWDASGYSIRSGDVSRNGQTLYESSNVSNLKLAIICVFGFFN